jgi:hypothetical protein
MPHYQLHYQKISTPSNPAKSCNKARFYVNFGAQERTRQALRIVAPSYGSH